MEVRDALIANVWEEREFFAGTLKMNRVDILSVMSPKGLRPVQRGKDKYLLFDSANPTMQPTMRDLDRSSLYDSRGNYGYFRFAESASFEISGDFSTSQMRAVFIFSRCSDIDAANRELMRRISCWQGCTVTGRSIDRQAIYQAEAPEGQIPSNESTEICSIDFTISTPININCDFTCEC